MSLLRLLLSVLIIVILAFGWCEYLLYEFVIRFRCSWPAIPQNGDSPTTPAKHSDQYNVVNTLLFADPHILGNRLGHPLDRLRREWQMLRTFQTTTDHLRPDLVTLLGDVFDEGKWASDVEFAQYYSRYREIFSLDHLSPEVKPQMMITAGNHDIGFHFATNYPLWSRFDKQFNSSPIALTTIGEGENSIHFIGINSIGFAGDSCKLCTTAKHKLDALKLGLDCARTKSQEHCSRIPLKDRKKYMHMTYSRPILLSHYPLYRESDSQCTAHTSAELKEYLIPESDRSTPFRADYDCINQQESEFILSRIQPRVIFSAHTHHGCLVYHKVPELRENIPEHSIPSMSWRNRNNPVLAMARFTPHTFTVGWCKLPEESTVIHLYVLTGIGIGVLVCYELVSYRRYKPKSQ